MTAADCSAPSMLYYSKKKARTRGTHQQLMLHSSDAQRSFLMEPYDNRFECYGTIKKKTKKKPHCVSVRACFISLFWQVKDCCRQVKNKTKKKNTAKFKP